MTQMCRDTRSAQYTLLLPILTFLILSLMPIVIHIDLLILSLMPTIIGIDLVACSNTPQLMPSYLC